MSLNREPEENNESQTTIHINQSTDLTSDATFYSLVSFDSPEGSGNQDSECQLYLSLDQNEIDHSDSSFERTLVPNLIESTPHKLNNLEQDSNERDQKLGSSDFLSPIVPNWDRSESKEGFLSSNTTTENATWNSCFESFDQSESFGQEPGTAGENFFTPIKDLNTEKKENSAANLSIYFATDKGNSERTDSEFNLESPINESKENNSSCEIESELKTPPCVKRENLVDNWWGSLTEGTNSDKEQDAAGGDCLVDESPLLAVKVLRKRFEALDLFCEGTVKGVRSYRELTSSKLELLESDSLVLPESQRSHIDSACSSQYNTLSLKTPLSEDKSEVKLALLADFDSIFGDITTATHGLGVTNVENMEPESENHVTSVQTESRVEMMSGDHQVIKEFDVNKLPETIHVLTGCKGAKVYLVGTAHFSEESQEDVRNIIRHARPTDIVVELCGSRRDIMLRNNHERMQDTPNPLSYQSISLSMKKHGSAMVGLLNCLLLYVSVKIQQKTGLTPGGEFRAAFEESQKLEPKANVYAGDRNVFVTLQRAWYSLSAWKRAHLLFTLATSDVDDITLEDVENCKGKDMLEQLLGELKKDFPELSRVIVSERDLYLANSIRKCADGRSAGDSIVAVVGIGHMKGIEDHWDSADSIDIKELEVIPRKKSLLPWMKLIKLGLLSGTLFITYRYFKK